MSAYDTQVGGDHYKNYKIQPMEFILKNDLGFVEGCVIKRICRYKTKNGIEDLKKIKHEVDFLIELLEKKEQAKLFRSILTDLSDNMLKYIDRDAVADHIAVLK